MEIRLVPTNEQESIVAGSEPVASVAGGEIREISDPTEVEANDAAELVAQGAKIGELKIVVPTAALTESVKGTIEPVTDPTKMIRVKPGMQGIQMMDGVILEGVVGQLTSVDSTQLRLGKAA